MSLRFCLGISDRNPGNKDFMCKNVGANICLQISSFVLPI